MTEACLTLLSVPLSAAAGAALDCLLGDPAWLPHPIRGIGLLVARLERAWLHPDLSAAQARARGRALVALVIGITGGVTAAVTVLAYMAHPVAGFIVASAIAWLMLSARTLQREALRVKARLDVGDLAGARLALSFIVGRDTQELSEEQVIKAAVETVAENTSDGIVAPFFYCCLTGPVGGAIYKAINTMDSMVGYKNHTYVNFGRAAARTDDAANYVPARLAALSMLAAAAASRRFDGKGARRVWRRDRRKHASPNSAQTESVCAGALGLALAGNASYGGVLHEKPVIGDAVRAPERADIENAVRLMWGTEAIFILVMTAASAALWGGVALWGAWPG